MASLATTPPPRVMDQKVATFSQQQQQQSNNNQEPLRCPRCDSSNTKFCYYNNYSLSQPRHFCKACKRYWTRGGTLRSVPVGGGCRKNKRVKRSPNNNNSSSSTTNNTSNNTTNLHEGSVNSLPSTNPLFYDHNLMNFPFSRYDFQNPPHINGLGLGFSSGLIHNIHVDGDFRNGLSMDFHSNKQVFQDLISSNTCLPNTPSTISSLLASTFQMKGGTGNFQTLLPSYEDSLHMKESGQGGMFTKDVKIELEGQNRSLDYQWSAPNQNHMDQNMGSSSPDPSVVWGNGPNLGIWLDPSNNNLSSSVPSLI